MSSDPTAAAADLTSSSSPPPQQPGMLPPPPLPPGAPPPPQAGRSGSPPPGGRPDGSGDASADPELVRKIVDDLKNRGIFDQVRKECLAEVDTKPAFQNLRQRVDNTLHRFLAKEEHRWNPNMNKNQLRNQLRKYIQEASYMSAGVERIVDQVVNPKVYSGIDAQVEEVIYDFLGVEKPSEKDMENGNGNGNGPEHAEGQKDQEKLSNISSEDIEMRSVGESESKAKESPRPPTAGDISPLTPDRKATESPSAPRGDISPLTPPMPPPPPATRETPVRPASPRTPPLPPLPPTAPQPHAAEVIVQSEEVVEEEVVAAAAQDASPVSDTELADVSPPKESPKTPSDSGLPSPPLPPLPPQPPPPGESSQSDNSIELPPLPPPPPEPEQQPPAPRPPSPLTSPIGSSPDDMEVDQPTAGGRKSSKSTSGPSDISDTDLPASQSESEDAGTSKDLDDLEKKRAALAKQLEKAKIEGEESEGEIRSDDDIDDASADYMKKFQAIIEGKEEIGPSKSPAKRTEDTSPVSDSISPLAISKNSSEEDEEGEEGKKKRDSDDSSCKPDAKAKRDDDSDDSKGDGGPGGSGSGGGRSRDAPRSSGEKSSSKSPKESDRKEGSSSSSGKRRDSSSSGSSKHKSHHRHHHKDDRRSSSSSSKRDHHGHHRRSSTSSRRDSESSSSSKHRRDSESRSDKHDKKKDSDHRDKKEDRKSSSQEKKEKKEKDRLKMESLEKKIREKGAMKSTSGAFKEVDMFAPKPPKPKVVPPGNRTPGSGPTSPFAFGAKSPPVYAVKTTPPPALPPKTPPVFGTKSTPQASSASKKENSSSSSLARRQSQEGRNGGSGDGDSHRVKTSKSFIVPDRVPERKVFPEVPVPSTEGDKLKQHENDIEMAKRALQEMRDRKRDELRRKEQQKKELKRQNSRQSDEGYTVKNREKTEKVVAKKSAPPPAAPTSREERRKSLEKPRKKLTLADLSDEDEVSDWSDSESPHVKKRIKQRPLPDSGGASSSNSGSSTPVHQTRKAALQTQSDQILRSDPETGELSHFTEEDCIAASQNLAKLHPFLDDEDALSVSSVGSDQFDSTEDFIYLDGLDSPDETAALLKKFGGCPSVVPAVPEWLQLKLEAWFLKRHEVDVFCRDVKPKRCVLEKTFNERVRKRFGLEYLPNEQPLKKMAKLEPKTEAEYKQEVKKEEVVKPEVKEEVNTPVPAADDDNSVKDGAKENKVDGASDAAEAPVADAMFVDDEMLPVETAEEAKEVAPVKSPEQAKETKEETEPIKEENGEVQEAKVEKEQEPSDTDTNAAANEEQEQEPMEVEPEEEKEEVPAPKKEEDFHGFTELPADDSRNLLANLWSKAKDDLVEGGFGFDDLLEHLEQEQALLDVGDSDEEEGDANGALPNGSVLEVTLPDFLCNSSQDSGEGSKQQELSLSPPDSGVSSPPSNGTAKEVKPKGASPSKKRVPPKPQENMRTTRSRRSVSKLM